MATTLRTQMGPESIPGANSPFARTYRAPEEIHRLEEPLFSALVLIAACDAFTLLSSAIFAAIFYGNSLPASAMLHLVAIRTAAMPERFGWYADFALFFILTAQRLDLLVPQLTRHPMAVRDVMLQRLVWVGLAGNALLLVSTRYSAFHVIPMAVVAISALIIPIRTLIHRMSAPQPRNTVILGTSQAAKTIGDYISHHSELGHQVRGFVTFPGAPEAVSGSSHLIFGDLSVLDEVVSIHFVDTIVLTEPCDPEDLAHLTALARRLGVNLKILACLHCADHQPRSLEYLGIHPVIQLFNRQTRGWRAGVKRLLDVLLSSLLLVIVAPVMLAIAVAIKLQGPGPVFYVSERIGRRGCPFRCFKFRSMVHDADRIKVHLVHQNERDSVLFKMKADPRITRLGAVLRKYSLDELPQLLNVLRGEMSLVGPRPPLRSEVQQYAARHLKRLDVLPGITGLWQVHARHDASFARYIDLDIQYVNHWSLLMDLKILARTAGVVVRGTGC